MAPGGGPATLAGVKPLVVLVLVLVAILLVLAIFGILAVMFPPQVVDVF